MAKTATPILDMTAKQARVFLLKSESYCSFMLPPYFSFHKTLQAVCAQIGVSPLDRKQLDAAKKCAEVNHRMLSNKDGRHAWRPFQLTHPALYVSLVNALTNPPHWKTVVARMKGFGALKGIKCCSLPVESTSSQSDQAVQILHWLEEVEQTSLELALEYNSTFHADVTDCYGALYTHSIAWALHNRDFAKKRRNDKGLLGNIVDTHLQAMHEGQTNGIPQGSVLMDFIAEFVLGYADSLLAAQLATMQLDEYRILRFRDDYRIFVNNPRSGEEILKALTEVLSELGLKLNSSKTKTALPVVNSALKADKWAWMCAKQTDQDLVRSLLLIYDHGTKFPNSGQLIRPLAEFRKSVKTRKVRERAEAIISIATEIAKGNPRALPACAAVVSDLLPGLPAPRRRGIVEKIHAKMLQLPYNGHMEVWLQRMGRRAVPDYPYKEKLCRLAQGKPATLWNCDWLSSANTNLRQALDAANIVDPKKVKRTPSVISPEEISAFEDFPY